MDHLVNLYFFLLLLKGRKQEGMVINNQFRALINQLVIWIQLTWYLHYMVSQNTLRKCEGYKVSFE